MKADLNDGPLGDRGAAARGAIEELRGAIAGDARDDGLMRALYSTDASLYEIAPDGVVLPKSVEDVCATVRVCAARGVPLTARGAGTGLTGGAVNRGIILDVSRHLNRVLEIDPEARRARVEPGVVLDELNALLKPHGLHFAPDVATSSRATIGGMISNNSCGAHSIRYGRTVDHVLSVDVVLADGSRHLWGMVEREQGTGNREQNPLARRCEEVLETIASEYAGEIAARYPKVLRRNGGYALDRLRVNGGAEEAGRDSREQGCENGFSHEQGRDSREGGCENGLSHELFSHQPFSHQPFSHQQCVNVETIVCGSEGTLCIVVGATLRLTPLPKFKALVAVHYGEMLEALESVPVLLEHHPAAIELIDKLIMDAAASNPAMAARRAFIEGDPQALLVVELFDEDARALDARLHALVTDLQSRRIGYAHAVIRDNKRQADVWEVRKSGLGLLMSRPGDSQPYAFVEDTAVPPEKLRDYIAGFTKILHEEGVEQAGYYAHASVGCLHVRPVLNLRKRDDVERMQRIADRVSSLALQFGGTMTGEHGDGIVRSCWLEKMYGPRIIEAFRRIKRTFDPKGIFNPGKIVDPLPMTSNLRYDHPRREPDGTMFDYSAHGGMAGLVGMCSGVGQCRQKLVGVMCPSYMATSDERHTTRARANALRLALSNRDLIQGLSDPALDEVMDLCLGCKACKTECPTNVDMAKLKSEWLWQTQKTRGVPRRSRLLASATRSAKWGCRLAPASNWVMQSRAARAAMERWYGLDRRMPPPRFARETFRQWFARNRPPERDVTIRLAEHRAGGADNRVVYFVDTWTNYYTPQVGVAAVQVLEALGFQVIVPPTVCCGRPMISKGLLDEAKKLAEQNASILRQYAERSLPIVGTEPSCILTFVDEFPQFVPRPDAKWIAGSAQTVESFVAAALADRPNLRDRLRPVGPLLYHGHCHQKALVGTAGAMKVLSAATGGNASEINSGCCGMAGSFGHEVEHYDVARDVGRQRLFPAIQGRGEAGMAISGFSCRHQIAHHTGVEARHVIEWMASALA